MDSADYAERLWSSAKVRATAFSQGRGADPRNLHCLHRMEPSIKELIPTKFALVNARSLGNKTFILNDFIGTNKLYILCGHIGLYCPTKINKAKTKRKSLVK